VLDASGATAVTKAALLLMLYTGLRDGSLRGAKWSEIDFEAAKWTIPAERMKRREEHSVPLPRQAVAVLKALHPSTHRGPDSFVFASSGKAGFLAENTLRIALHRLGFEVTAHGFRSLLTDELYKAGFRSEWSSGRCTPRQECSPSGLPADGLLRAAGADDAVVGRQLRCTEGWQESAGGAG